MSNKYELFNAIMADTTLTAVAKNVAAVLLITFRNNKTGLCNPSFETIAKRAGCSVRAAKQAAQAMKAAGWLDWTGTKGGGKGNTNHFRFILKTDFIADYGADSAPIAEPETVQDLHTNLLLNLLRTSLLGREGF
jgi:hypothetical protein